MDMVVDVNALTFAIKADELEIFLQDANEHLVIMEAGILRLEQASDSDTLRVLSALACRPVDRRV